MLRLFLCITLLLIPLPAISQSSGRTELMQLVEEDCGVGTSDARFRATVIADPTSARNVFRQILRGGPKQTLLDSARTDALAEHDRYTEWAKRHSQKPHVRAFLAGPGRAAFADEAAARLDTTVRANALRGLSLIGEASDREVIEATIKTHPTLERAGRDALNRITNR